MKFIQRILKPLLVFFLFIDSAEARIRSALPYINEFHYCNRGADVNEFVEIAVDENDTNSYKILLYDGHSKRLYGTLSRIEQSRSINGTKYIVFASPSNPGLQNGDEGLALVNQDGVVYEFLSYEGTFKASNSYARNILSTDVGVQEREGSPASHSLQRLSDGSTKWTGPLSNSRGQPNFGATAKPSRSPTKRPTKSPTKAPATAAPTKAPATAAPTKAPATAAPTKAPATVAPTKAPATAAPTKAPATAAPTKAPATAAPTKAPATVAPTLSYNIDLDLFGIDASDSALFTNAKLRWESIIRGDLSDISTTGLAPPAAGCAYPSVVDDLYICARFVPIDGPFNVVGFAGPQYIRTLNSLTIIGDMVLDSADVGFIRSLGFFGTVVLHEMGHVFGIGTLWELANVTGPDASNCPYNGPRANAEYQAITGCDVVPTENSGTINDGTFCGHWDEECMKSELMTGFLNGGLNPLSRITIATLDDLGYTVDYSTAESYGTNDVNSACTCGGQRLLSESSKLNTVHQLGTSHRATRRRALSEKGNEEAVRYGQSILLQRRLQKKNSFRVNSTEVPNDMLYIGDKVLVVFIEEDGAFFDVTVTL